MKKNWFEEFEIGDLSPKIDIDKSDYDVFEDKDLLDKFRNNIIQELIDNNISDSSKLSQYINEEIDRITDGYDLSSEKRNHLFNLIENEVNGYGPITELLDDKNVTEIMINSPNEIYIEVDGILSRDKSVSFINDEHIIRTIQRIVQPLGRTIDTSNPMVDARLEDGSRLNAVIPPLSLKGPVLTIRKFRRDMESVEDFLRTGAMTPYMARFLEAAVKAGAELNLWQMEELIKKWKTCLERQVFLIYSTSLYAP